MNWINKSARYIVKTRIKSTPSPFPSWAKPRKVWTPWSTIESFLTFTEANKKLMNLDLRQSQQHAIFFRGMKVKVSELKIKK